MMKQLDWYGLYKDSWQGEIVDEAFAHPAKYARGMIRAIYDYLIEQGYLKPGDTVIDPFGGVALGAFDALRHGLHWVGVELEPRFTMMAQGMDCPGFTKSQWRRYYNRISDGRLGQDRFPLCPTCLKAMHPKIDRLIPEREAHRYQGNFDLWQQRYGGRFRKWGTARIINGDSRNLAALVEAAGAGDVGLSCPCVVQLGKDKRETSNGKIQQETNSERGFTGIVPRASIPAEGSGDFGSIGTVGQAVDGPVQDRIAGYEGGREPALYSWGDCGQLRVQKEGAEHLGLRAMPDGNQPLCSPQGLRPLQQSPGQLTSALRVVSHDPPQKTVLGFQEARREAKEKQWPGRLVSGKLDAALTSPPYADAVKTGEGPGARHDPIHHNGDNAYKQSSQAEYGRTPGNLGNMAGGFDAAVASPPFEANGHQKQELNGKNRLVRTNPRFEGEKLYFTEYAVPDSLGQIGNTEGETFWAAARQILEQTYQVLRPGAVAAFVTGDFVRDGKRVFFGRQWMELCEAVGFEPVEWIVAWKVERRGEQLDIFGNFHSMDINRMSFFRLLANRKNPDAAILNEDIIIMRKPDV
jgi:hypothetical protein